MQTVIIAFAITVGTGLENIMQLHTNVLQYHGDNMLYLKTVGGYEHPMTVTSPHAGRVAEQKNLCEACRQIRESTGPRPTRIIRIG